ncbi:MAG TPA: glycosyltransferase, partial [Acidimicrobiales bacterium]|nr:glycosyltransferase [Acidimicrobiales bacterium]
MIVRNEEPLIPGVLGDAALFCDELVVVDTGSSDGTKAVAARHGARVFDFHWVDDFAAARNFAFDQCTRQWVIWLDADDRIPPEAVRGFVHLKRQLQDQPGPLAVEIPYRVSFSKNDPSNCTFSCDRRRVVRADAGFRWVGAVHEDIRPPHAQSLRWPLAWVEHRPPSGRADRKHERNLRILERLVSSGDHSSRTLFYYGNELRDVGRLQEAIAAYREFLQTANSMGWERYFALLNMAACAEGLGYEDEKFDLLVAAMRTDSTRAEAFVRLGVHYYRREEWQKAIPFFSAAASALRPLRGFVYEADYSSAPWDFLSICHSKLGMYQEALQDTDRALASSDDRVRLLANARYY